VRQIRSDFNLELAQVCKVLSGSYSGVDHLRRKRTRVFN